LQSWHAVCTPQTNEGVTESCPEQHREPNSSNKEPRELLTTWRPRGLHTSTCRHGCTPSVWNFCPFEWCKLLSGLCAPFSSMQS